MFPNLPYLHLSPLLFYNDISLCDRRNSSYSIIYGFAMLILCDAEEFDGGHIDILSHEYVFT